MLNRPVPDANLPREETFPVRRYASLLASIADTILSASRRNRALSFSDATCQLTLQDELAYNAIATASTSPRVMSCAPNLCERLVSTAAPDQPLITC
jgi:hypothetical protein